MAQEKRAHARIAVPVSARLVDGSRELELAVRDISRGGIFLYTKNPPGKVGKVVTLKLAITAGLKPVVISAEITRIVMDTAERGGGVLGMGLQFVRLNEERERQLIDLLDRAMLGPGTNSRAYPRVYHLLDVVCRSTVELRALLRDIGEGGVGLTVDRPLTLDEPVSIEISRTGETALRLDGWVVSQEKLPDESGRYRAGIRFARLAPEMRQKLNDWMKRLYRK